MLFKVSSGFWLLSSLLIVYFHEYHSEPVCIAGLVLLRVLELNNIARTAQKLLKTAKEDMQFERFYKSGK